MDEDYGPLDEDYSDIYQTERSSTSAMISGILIMISSVAILIIGSFQPASILGFAIALILGWGLTKLGSRRVLTNPEDVLKRIRALEKDKENKILREIKNEKIDEDNIEEMEKKIREMQDKY